MDGLRKITSLEAYIESRMCGSCRGRAFSSRTLAASSTQARRNAVKPPPERWFSASQRRVRTRTKSPRCGVIGVVMSPPRRPGGDPLRTDHQRRQRTCREGDFRQSSASNRSAQGRQRPSRAHQPIQQATMAIAKVPGCRVRIFRRRLFDFRSYLPKRFD